MTDKLNQWLSLLAGTLTPSSALKSARQAAYEGSHWQAEKQRGWPCWLQSWCTEWQRHREREDRNRHSYTVWLRQQADTSGILQLSRGLRSDGSMNTSIFCQRRLNPQHLLTYPSRNELHIHSNYTVRGRHWMCRYLYREIPQVGGCVSVWGQGKQM